MKKNISIPTLLVLILFITSCKQQRLNTTNKTELEILSLAKLQDTSRKYNLTFWVKQDTSQTLSMLIGEYEAQSLAIAIEQLHPKAPLPLDLLQDAIKKMGYTVKEILIDGLINNIYTAKIICTGNNKTIELTARPVDAVTVALKFKSPVYANNDLPVR